MHVICDYVKTDSSHIHTQVLSEEHKKARIYNNFHAKFYENPYLTVFIILHQFKLIFLKCSKIVTTHESNSQDRNNLRNVEHSRYNEH